MGHLPGQNEHLSTTFRFAETRQQRPNLEAHRPWPWLPSIRVGQRIDFNAGLRTVQEQILKQRNPSARFPMGSDNHQGRPSE